MKKIYVFVILLVVFSTSTIFNFVNYSKNVASMGRENAKEARKEIIEIHSVLLAILIGGLFARPGKDEYINLPTSVVTVAFSILWALYIYQSWSGYPATINANGPNGLIDQFSDRSTQLSGLIAGLLGYVCKKEHTRKKERRMEAHRA